MLLETIVVNAEQPEMVFRVQNYVVSRTAKGKPGILDVKWRNIDFHRTPNLTKYADRSSTDGNIHLLLSRCSLLYSILLIL